MSDLITPGDPEFNAAKRLSAFGQMHSGSDEMSDARKQLFAKGATDNEDVVREMRANRRVNSKTGSWDLILEAEVWPQTFPLLQADPEIQFSIGSKTTFLSISLKRRI